MTLLLVVLLLVTQSLTSLTLLVVLDTLLKIRSEWKEGASR